MQSAYTTKDLETRCQESLLRLEYVNQNLSHFAHTVAHDLREPLRGILGYCTLIRESDVKASDSLGTFIDRIHASAKRMSATIESLMAISNIREPLAFSNTICLNQAVHWAVENLSAAIHETGAKVEVDELPRVQGDQSLLTQLFQNLIANSIKFTKSGQPAHVRIYARVKSGNRVIVVEDNGIGISKEHHDRIFDYFKRINTVEKYEGFGLGLAICKRIADLHRGRIWVESTPGEGSQFFIDLPMS